MLFKKQKFYALFMLAGWSLLALFWSNNSVAFAQTNENWSQVCRDGSEKINLILIDQSALYDTSDKERLASWYTEERARLAGGERIIIYTINQFSNDVKSLFDYCVPFCREDKQSSFSDKCRRGSDVRQKKSFLTIFAQTLSNLLDGEDQRYTPIILSIRSILSEIPQNQLSRLVIFSDMIEYSREFNMAINSFSKDKADKILQEIPERAPMPYRLENTQIEIVGLGKKLGIGNVSDEEREKLELPLEAKTAFEYFWLNFFQDILGNTKNNISNPQNQ